MKFVNVFFSVDPKGRAYVKGEVEVPGIGNVVMPDCLSLETQERIMREVEAAAQQRLAGQVAQPQPQPKGEPDWPTPTVLL